MRQIKKSRHCSALHKPTRYHAFLKIYIVSHSSLIVRGQSSSAKAMFTMAEPAAQLDFSVALNSLYWPIQDPVCDRPQGVSLLAYHFPAAWMHGATVKPA